MKSKQIKQKIVKQENIVPFQIKDWHVIVFFAIITIIFFWEIIIQKRYFWEDFVYQYYPFRNFAAVALSQGIIPFWNPYTFAGMPFIADIQTAFFYPLHIFLTLFVKDNSLNFVYLEYLIIFHYFLAGVFSYYLAKSLNLNVFAAILTGITFMFSGFMVTHLIHETMVIQFAYSPLILLFYNKSFQKDFWKNSVLAGFFMGIAILCGHPQITLYTFFTFALFGVFRLFFVLKENNYRINNFIFKTIIVAVIPFIIGIMIGSIQLLPTLTISGLSERAIMTYEATLEGSLNYHQFFTLLSPKFFGSTNAAHTDVPFWGDKGYWLYWESCIYIGLVALIFWGLAVIKLKENKMILFFSITSFISLLYILGDHFILYKFFYYVIPGFNKFRGVGRFGLVFAFSASILAGFGFDYFIKNKNNNDVNKYLKFVLIGIGLLVILWILYQLNVFKSLANVYQNPIFYKNSIYQLGLSILFLLIIIGLLFSYKKDFLYTPMVLVLIIIISFFDLYIFGSNHNTSPINPNQYYKQRETAREFREEYKKELFRINSRAYGNAMFFERNQGMIDFIFLLEGYNPLNLLRRFPPGKTYELLNVKYETKLDLERRVITLNEKQFYMPRAWMSYKPIVVNNDDEIIKIMSDSTFNYKECVVIEKSPELSIDTVPGNNNVKITNYDLNKITISVETDKNGILVLSEVFYPAWKVYVDGVEKPILRCDYSLRGVEVEKGKHVVKFSYEDKDFKLGLVLSISGLGFVIVILVFNRFKKEKAA